MNTARFERFALLVRDPAPGGSAGRWAVLAVAADREPLLARFRALTPYCTANRIGLAVVGLEGTAARLLHGVPAGVAIGGECPSLTPAEAAAFETRRLAWRPGSERRRTTVLSRYRHRIDAAARIGATVGGSLAVAAAAAAAVVLFLARDPAPPEPELLANVSLDRPVGTDWFIRSGPRYRHYRTEPGKDPVYVGDVKVPRTGVDPSPRANRLRPVDVGVGQ